MILDWFRRRKQQDVEKTNEGLQKTRQRLFTQLAALFERSELDEVFYEDLEAVLIGADIGVDTTREILAQLRGYAERNGITRPADAREALRQGMIELLQGALVNRKVRILQRGVPFVIMVGVNGVGKTTSIAKLAAYHQGFPAVRLWSLQAIHFEQRRSINCEFGESASTLPVIAHEQGADPGAVVFDAVQAALQSRARRFDC